MNHSTQIRRTRRLQHLGFLFLSTLLVGAWVAQAHANGRPANTTSFYVNPTNPNQIFMGTTFGAAISKDCGASFQWVCEGAMVPGGFAQADYSFFWGRDSTMLVQGVAQNAYGGVSRSTDGGCNWTPPGEFNTLVSLNLSGDPQDSNIVFVPAYDPNLYIGYVYRSADVGATFQRTSLAQNSTYWYSVQASAYSPQVVVAAGRDTSNNGPYLATSTDQGSTWSIQQTNIGTATQVDLPMVTLHPTDPNVLFLAVALYTTGDASTIVLRSTDRGASATPVTLRDANNTAITPAGTVTTVYRDMRIAEDGNRIWLSTDSALYFSEDGGLNFSLLPTPSHNSCVSYFNGTVYACGNDTQDGFAMASSRDNGKTFSPGFLLASLTQATCDASSGSTTLCTGSGQGQWGYYSEVIGAGTQSTPSPKEPNFVSLANYCSAACLQGGDCNVTGSGADSGAPAKGGGSGCNSISSRTGMTWLVCIAAAWAMATQHRRNTGMR